MKDEVQYQWRIKWSGRWTTSHYCNEDDIRREHPEAKCIEATRRVTRVPSTDEERNLSMYGPPRGWPKPPTG